jgi:hypothetical protein
MLSTIPPKPSRPTHQPCLTSHQGPKVRNCYQDGLWFTTFSNKNDRVRSPGHSETEWFYLLGWVWKITNSFVSEMWKSVCVWHVKGGNKWMKETYRAVDAGALALCAAAWARGSTSTVASHDCDVEEVVCWIGVLWSEYILVVMTWDFFRYWWYQKKSSSCCCVRMEDRNFRG